MVTDKSLDSLFWIEDMWTCSSILGSHTRHSSIVNPLVHAMTCALAHDDTTHFQDPVYGGTGKIDNVTFDEPG